MDRIKTAFEFIENYTQNPREQLAIMITMLDWAQNREALSVAYSNFIREKTIKEKESRVD